MNPFPHFAHLCRLFFKLSWVFSSASQEGYFTFLQSVCLSVCVIDFFTFPFIKRVNYLATFSVPYGADTRRFAALSFASWMWKHRRILSDLALLPLEEDKTQLQVGHGVLPRTKFLFLDIIFFLLAFILSERV